MNSRYEDTYRVERTTDDLGGRYLEPRLNMETRSLAWAEKRARSLTTLGSCAHVRRTSDGAVLAPDGSWLKPLAFAFLALLLAFPALAAPAHRIRPLETITVKTMPTETLKPGESLRLTALDADSCTVWIEEAGNGETAFRACRSAILRCQAGDCRKAGVR